MNVTHPTGHETETTKTRTDTKSTLSAELDSDKTERLITRRDKSEVRTAEQVRRQSSELGLREDTIRVELHQARQFLRSEASVKIDDGTDTDELDRRALLETEFVGQYDEGRAWKLALTETA